MILTVNVSLPSYTNNNSFILTISHLSISHPGSNRLYRLGVPQAQKAKESGDERSSVCPVFPFFPFLYHTPIYILSIPLSHLSIPLSHLSISMSHLTIYIHLCHTSIYLYHTYWSLLFFVNSPCIANDTGIEKLVHFVQILKRKRTASEQNVYY